MKGEKKSELFTKNAKSAQVTSVRVRVFLWPRTWMQ